MYQFPLLDILRPVGIEVHRGLLIIQSGEVSDVVAFFHDAQTFLRQRHGIAEILQPDFLLDVVVVFRREGGDEIFDGNPGVGGSLSFQLLQLLVSGTDVEPVENCPVQVETRIQGLVVHTAEFGGFFCLTRLAVAVVRVSGIAGGQVYRRQVSRISQSGVVLAHLLFVAGDAERIIVGQSFFQALLQGIGVLGL